MGLITPGVGYNIVSYGLGHGAPDEAQSERTRRSTVTMCDRTRSSTVTICGRSP